MRISLMLCIPAVIIWGYALIYSIFAFFSVPLFSEYHHIITAVMIFFAIITFMITSILVNLVRRMK